MEERIERALKKSGRPRSDVTLVAVSKKFSAPHIREAYLAGQRAFGENYVQEFAEKAPLLSDLEGTAFHFIGHLQSNKARQAALLFQVIHTADSVRLIQRLEDAARERESMLEILLEIKVSPEQSKTGAPPEAIPELLEASGKCAHLRVSGLMTMPPWSENAEESRPYFQRLASLATEFGLPELSMGMSQDLEVAIEEGATIVRVGTALFGPRPKPQSSDALVP